MCVCLQSSAEAPPVTVRRLPDSVPLSTPPGPTPPHRSPPPCRSPIFLAQVVYKVAFLATAILPLAYQGRWTEFCLGPTAVYAAYLPILLFCAPWDYLLGGGDAQEGRSDRSELKRE